MNLDRGKTKLWIDYCSYEAAKYAVLHWHYSKALPAGQIVKYGCWYDRSFWGAILFARGACYRIGDAFGLDATEICELTRVALAPGHPFFVTQAISVALRFLKVHCPGLRVVVSYADPEQGHRGRIYQAGNWVDLGKSSLGPYGFIGGRWVHARTFTDTKKSKAFRSSVSAAVKAGYKVERRWKWKFAYPLDDQGRKAIDKYQMKMMRRASSGVRGTTLGEAVQTRPCRSELITDQADEGVMANAP